MLRVCLTDCQPESEPACSVVVCYNNNSFTVKTTHLLMARQKLRADCTRFTKSVLTFHLCHSLHLPHLPHLRLRVANFFAVHISLVMLFFISFFLCILFLDLLRCCCRMLRTFPLKDLRASVLMQHAARSVIALLFTKQLLEIPKDSERNI